MVSTLRPVYERTDLVDEAVGTAVRALVEGSLLVAIVLFLFLGEIRSAIVVIAALPVAMLIAFIFMGEAGLSANLMSLAGLGSRHRDDGRWRRGHGGKRLQDHGRA